MKTKCLNCDNEVSQTDGKRERLYCSDNCRAEFNQKKKRKTMSIPMETWQSSVIKFKENKDGQWNLSDGRKGDFVWAKDETTVETKHVHLPPKEASLTIKETGAIQYATDKPNFKTDMEREIWEDEQRILNSKK